MNVAKFHLVDVSSLKRRFVWPLLQGLVWVGNWLRSLFFQSSNGLRVFVFCFQPLRGTL